MGAPDYEKYMMAQPVPVEPGSAFCYSSADSILAAHMVERAVGKRMGPLASGWESICMRKYSSPLIWDGRSGSMIHRDIRMAAEVCI